MSQMSFVQTANDTEWLSKIRQLSPSSVCVILHHQAIHLYWFQICLCWLGSRQLICQVCEEWGDLGYSGRGHLIFLAIQPFQSPPPLFHQVTHLHDPRTRNHVSLFFSLSLYAYPFRSCFNVLSIFKVPSKSFKKAVLLMATLRFITSLNWENQVIEVVIIYSPWPPKRVNTSLWDLQLLLFGSLPVF